MKEEIICKKSDRKSSLFESNISWSSDSITTCNLCGMNVWDSDFDKLHLELSISVEGYQYMKEGGCWRTTTTIEKVRED